MPGMLPLNREKCWEKGRGLCSSKVLSLTAGAPDPSSGVPERNTRNSPFTRAARADSCHRRQIDAHVRLHSNGGVARDFCPSSGECFLFVMGAAHLSSAFAHLANPRQWSRAPTCYLKGSGAESGSSGHCGLKPSRGLIRVICGLMTNMELPGRCVLLAALVMSVPHPACSGQCFLHVNYSPARAIKTRRLAKRRRMVSDSEWRTDWYGEMGVIWICKTNQNFACAYTPNKILLNPANLHSDWFRS